MLNSAPNTNNSLYHMNITTTTVLQCVDISMHSVACIFPACCFHVYLMLYHVISQEKAQIYLPGAGEGVAS